MRRTRVKYQAPDWSHLDNDDLLSVAHKYQAPDWSYLADEDLVSVAQRYVDRHLVYNRPELADRASEMYHHVFHRGLMDRLHFPCPPGSDAYHGLPADQLVLHAQRFVDENRIPSRTRLQAADSILYGILAKRGVLDQIKFPNGPFWLVLHPPEKWAGMDSDEIVYHVQSYLDLKGVRCRTDLNLEYPELHRALSQRKLLSRLCFPRCRNWKSLRFDRLDDDELVFRAEVCVRRGGVTGRTHLFGEAASLYRALSRRRLLDRLAFALPADDLWPLFDNEQLVRYAQRLVDKRGIEHEVRLKERVPGLHRALRRRELLDKIVFVQRTGSAPNWRQCTDRELVDHCQQFVDDKGLKRRNELRRADMDLYRQMHERKLLERVTFQGRRAPRTNWSRYSDDELVALAQDLINAKEINTWTGLEREVRGLCGVLRSRVLLHKVILPMRPKSQRWDHLTDHELVSHAQRYVQERAILDKTALNAANVGLWDRLHSRGLLRQIAFPRSNTPRNREKWSEMSDDELLAYAQRLVVKNGLPNTTALLRNANGMYRAVKEAGLLYRIRFPAATAAKKRKGRHRG